MSSNSDETPYSDSHLDSPEYRKRLMRKLNTLVAVLEVACAKVRRSLAGPDPDTERLRRIYKNLRDTLQVCLRAKKALERSEKLPEDLPSHLTQVSKIAHQSEEQSAGTPNDRGERNVEMTSSAEEQKFEKLGPIDPKELRGVDLDELCRQLLG